MGAAVGGGSGGSGSDSCSTGCGCLGTCQHGGGRRLGLLQPPPGAAARPPKHSSFPLDPCPQLIDTPHPRRTRAVGCSLNLQPTWHLERHPEQARRAQMRARGRGTGAKGGEDRAAPASARGAAVGRGGVAYRSGPRSGGVDGRTRARGSAASLDSHFLAFQPRQHGRARAKSYSRGAQAGCGPGTALRDGQMTACRALAELF